MSSLRFRAWPTETRLITQPFGARPDYYAQFGLPGPEGIDVAAPVGSQIFAAEETFTQSWFLRNNGNHAWGPGYTLTCISGPTLNAPSSVPLPALASGAEEPVTVTMIAPTQAGRHTSVWQPTDANGKRFGDLIWVEIQVPAPTISLPATPDPFVQRNGRAFVEVLDEAENRVRDALVGWNWEGNQAAPPAPRCLDKPLDEPGCDIPLSPGTFKLWVMGAPSEEAVGFHYRHGGETAASGELFNSFGHHSFYVVFQRVRKEASLPAVGGDDTGDALVVEVVKRSTYVQPQNLAPDRVVIQPGQPFIQAWTLSNHGPIAWENGYKLAWVADEALGAPSTMSIPPCAPGNTVQLLVAFVAPTNAGHYQSTWQLCNERNEPVGQPIVVAVEVDSR